MRWATARAVSSSGPISAAMAMTVGATSLRQLASGAPPCLRVGAITEAMVRLLACEPYVLRHTICLARTMLGDIRMALQDAANGYVGCSVRQRRIARSRPGPKNCFKASAQPAASCLELRQKAKGMSHLSLELRQNERMIINGASMRFL